MTINRVTLIGNLTKDAELCETAHGNAVVNMTVAVNQRYPDRVAGTMREKTAFVCVSMYGPKAAHLHPDLKKASRVVVDGELRTETWAGRDGKRTKLDVVATNVEVVTPAQSAQSGLQ